MSEIIKRLRAEYPNDPRPADELTLLFGRWAEENGRVDLFESHADFAAEYRELRNAARRAADTRSTLQQLRDAAIRGGARVRQGFNVLTGIDEENAADVAAAQRTIDENQPSPETQEFMEAPDRGLGRSVLELLRNPKVAVETAVESLPASMAALGGAAAGAGAGLLAGLETGPGAIATAAVGMGVGSGASEYASKVLQVLEEAGMDIRDPVSIQQFFADESLMAKARDLAIKRAIPIAVFDGASLALAGSFTKPLLAARAAGKAPGMLRAAGAAAGELGLQAGAGGAGEFLGQRVAGEDYSGKDIALEMVAEIATGPGEVLSNLKLGRRPAPAAPATNPPAPPAAGAPAAITPPATPPTELDVIAKATQAVRDAQAAVQAVAKEAEAADLFAQEQDEIARLLAAQRAREALAVESGTSAVPAPPPVDELAAGLALAGAEPAPAPSELGFMANPPEEPNINPALAMAGARAPGVFEASPLANPDAGLFEQPETAGVISPVDAFRMRRVIQAASAAPVPAAPVTKPTKTESPPTLAPTPIPTVPVITPTEPVPAARSIRVFEDVALPSADRVAEISDFVPDKSGDYSVAIILQDNKTGNVYQRGLRRGRQSEITVELAQSRKGASAGRGQARAAETDMEFGTVNRPLRTVMAEKLGDQPRFTVLGYTNLEAPQKSAAINFGPTAAYQAHPDVQRLVKAGFDQAVLPKRTTGRRPAAAKKTGLIAGSAKAGDVEVASGLVPEVAATAAAESRITPVSAPLQMLEAIAAEVSKLGREAAVERASQMLEALARKKGVKPADPAIYRAAAESLVEDATALTVRPPAANTVPAHESGPLFASALQSVRAAGGDVAIFEKNAASRFEAAQKGWGIITTGPTGQRLIALGVDSLRGRHDATTKLLHEIGHLISDGLPEPVHRAFHLAIDRLHWADQRWALNPLSVDLRILANADPAALSPAQREALASFTPEEIARAKQTPREELVREQAAEHLAMLGVDKAQANSLLDRLFRVVKGVLLQVAMALQQAIKGETHISERLARAYVENQFLSFIHGDTRALASFSTWIGAPATKAERVTAYASLSDGDFRAVQYDPVTREVMSPDISTHEQAALRDRLEYVLTRAEQAAKKPQADTALTRRADAVDYTPGIQFDSEAAAINLQEQHLKQIFEDVEIRPLLPRADNPFRAFLEEWIGMPESQWPETRRQLQATIATTARDPLTGQLVQFNPESTVDSLPSIDEGDGRRISSAQDYALRQTLRFLYETERRVMRRLETAIDELNRLKSQAEKKTLSEEGRAELSELSTRVPILAKVVSGNAGLRTRIREIESRLAGADAFVAVPGGDFPVPPSPTATEEEILKNRKTIPKDLQFANREEFFGHLVAIRDWLENPANRNGGRLYGHLTDVLAKLQDLAVTSEYVANTFRLRRTMTKSLAGKLRDIGTPIAIRLAKPFLAFQSHMNQFQQDARILGTRWSEALDKFGGAMGEPLSEAFLDRYWNHLMRALESINEGAGNPFELAERAMGAVAGLELKGEKQRAAFRHLIMETRENERFFRQVFEQLGLKVLDKDLVDSAGRPLLRRLVSQGYVTGRRSASRHLVALFQQMNPIWSDTASEQPFLDNAGLLYGQNREQFNAEAARYFTPAVIRDFVEPLALNNANHFRITEEGGIERDASLHNVRRAWREAKGDVTRFAELLHAAEGLPAGQEARTVGSVMRDLGRMFGEIKRDAEERMAAENNGMEITPRQMMDARLAGNWPADWVSYATFDPNANLRLLHQLAINAAFGRNGFGPSGAFTSNLSALRRELQDLQVEEDRLRRDEGLSAAEVKKRMGADRYQIALQAHEHLDMLHHIEDGLKAVTKTTGYLIGDFKLLNELMSFSATSALQNPRSAGMQAFDILAPFYKFKFSAPAFRAVFRAGSSLASGVANSVLQAVGSNFAFNADAARRRIRNGYKDPDNYISWRQKLSDRGHRLNLAQPDHPENVIGRASRQGIYVLRRLRDSVNVGPTSANALGPKLRPGLFGTLSEAVYGATVDALYDSFADLASRGVEWIGRMDPASRARLLRQLESGSYVPTARDLGYHRKFGILNDAEALAYLKDALESKLWGERGLGQFLAGVWRRKEQGLSELTDHQFRQIANLGISEWGLQSSIASSPHWVFTNPVLRVGMIFLVWPWNAMTRFAETFRDPRGRIDHQTILDGSIAMVLGAVPLTLAGSLAFDWYDERVLGKKQNIRELSGPNMPVAALERVARYGTAGLASEILNQVVNYDSARNLSLDTRIFAINQLRNVFEAMSTLVQQEGNATYGSVGRPVMQAVGGSGLLHYLQIIDNQLPGVNNEDEAINRRINTGNYLRAAGRALDLDVRVFRGASANPTPVTPYLQQMEFYALAGDQAGFVRAYQTAVRAAREMEKEDPEKYVVDSFADRHPLRRLFLHAPSTRDYRRMLGQLDETGRKAVGEAVNSYNRMLERLGKPAYLGRDSNKPVSVESLIRQAEREIAGDSLFE